MKDELIEKAKSLGLDATKFGEDEGKLEAAIKEKEEEAKKNSDPEYLKTEAKKAFEARDKAKADARKLADKVKEMEDKQKIFDALCKALQLTRSQSDLVSLEYHQHSEDREEVIVKYTSGSTRRINTSLDSGLAMIRDVCEHIG